jgi:hypothetical protein
MGMTGQSRPKLRDVGVDGAATDQGHCRKTSFAQVQQIACRLALFRLGCQV